MASDNDTTTPVDTPQEKPAENTEQPVRETAAGDNHEKAPEKVAEKPERKAEDRKSEERHTRRGENKSADGRAAEAKAPADTHKAAEHKPVEHKSADQPRSENRPDRKSTRLNSSH